MTDANERSPSLSYGLNISKVEGQIVEVECQIKTVEAAIKKVEAILERDDLEREDKVYWREKEKQLREKEKQLREKEKLLMEKEKLLMEEKYKRDSGSGRPPLHPNYENENIRKTLDEMADSLRKISTGSDRATPIPTPTSEGRQQLERLQSNDAISVLKPGDYEGPAILTETQGQEVKSVSTEHQLVAYLTPFLEEIFAQHPGGLRIYNSEEYAWLHTSTDDTRYNQKPDILICHPAFCKRRSPFKTTDDKVLKLRREGDLFGVLADWRLRDSIGLTGEAKMLIDNRAFGQAINYGSHICFDNGPVQTKLVLFDCFEFWLLESTKGIISRVKPGEWTMAGSKAAFKTFVVSDKWTILVQEALHHFSLTIDPNDSFLGAGGSGRVLVVYQANGVKRALKVVIAEENELVTKLSLEMEFEMMNRAHEKCPEYVMGVEAMAWFGYGGAILQSNVGQHYTDLESKVVKINESLRILHDSGFIHGDARLENVVAVDGKACWIDLRQAQHFNTETGRQYDRETLKESMNLKRLL